MAPARHVCSARSHQGLLEPVARKAGTACAEGTSAQQRAGVTRGRLVADLPKTALAGQDFTDYDEIAHATRVATAELNARARPWIWGRPQPKPRSYRRRLYTAFRNVALIPASRSGGAELLFDVIR